MALGQTSPTPISRGEFGVVGTERILDVLRQHQVPATWFIPGITIETYPQVCSGIHDQGHEIGHHGFRHVSPVTLSKAEELDALQKGNDAIRKITGNKAKGYRSPAWDLSEHSIELLIGEVRIFRTSPG